jgi:hypothetical protein
MKLQLQALVFYPDWKGLHSNFCWKNDPDHKSDNAHPDAGKEKLTVTLTSTHNVQNHCRS